MITGFNTDIKHGDRVFHVQTEDRGAGNPVVESLVYVGGQILLSKRSPYSDLIADGKVDEAAVRQLMDLQHRRIGEDGAWRKTFKGCTDQTVLGGGLFEVGLLHQPIHVGEKHRAVGPHIGEIGRA